jgi:Uma2 family endonuclease
MRPAGPGVKLTYDDYLLFPDDGQRHELIDGEHYVTPTPILPHQRVLGNLYFAIRGYLESHKLGEVFMAPLDVILSKHDVVEPDLLYVSNERRDILGQWVHGAPDLAVEIASPGTRKRDETITRRLYERAGVSDYWIVDPDLDLLRLYRRGGSGFDRPVELSLEAGNVLTTPLLPGYEMPLAKMFQE